MSTVIDDEDDRDPEDRDHAQRCSCGRCRAEREAGFYPDDDAVEFDPDES